MGKLLAIVGSIMVVIGLAGALLGFIGSYSLEGDNFDNTINCTSGSPTPQSTICYSSDHVSDNQATFSLMQTMTTGGGALMVTGGAFIAGACALAARGSRNESHPAPVYAGAPVGYGGPPTS